MDTWFSDSRRDIDIAEFRVGVRRTNEVKMHAIFEQWIAHIGDIGAADRQEPWVFSPEDALAEYAHGPRLGPERPLRAEC